MKKVLLTTCNAKYIHKNLALRWMYTTCPHQEDVILKEYIIKDTIENIIKDICEMQAEVICFSCYIWNITLIRELIGKLKRELPLCHIVVGGPEVSYESNDLLDIGVDAICIGEGEESLWEYVQMLSSEPKEIRGMYTKAYPNTVYRKTSLDFLEQFEDPYFLDFDKKDLEKRYFYLETSRGCPYGCTYCLSSTDRQVRMFSESYIIKLLEKIASSKVRQVKLLDRTFNSDPNRALRIARYMNENCHKQIFQFEIVAETLSEELLTFFCEEADISRFRFEIGVQSFNHDTLVSVGRIQNNERLREVIERLHKAGCTMHVDLIAGLPYEDIHSFQSSFDALFALQASEVQLGILKLLKGTKLRKQKDTFAMEFEIQAPYNILSTFWLSSNELMRIHQCADAVEKFWNSGACSGIISVMLQKGWYDSAFTLFMDLGQEFAKLPRPYQPDALFQCFYPLLEAQEKEIADALLLTHYYPRFKQKPHRFCDGYITREKKKEIITFALEKKIANQDVLYRYGVCDIAYQETIGYQLILFNAQQTYPKQYLLDKNITEIKENI